MIYQDFALCGNMDVGQNIFLGRWPRKGLFVDRRKMYAEADEVLKRLKVDVNSVYQRVESLSGGRQQSVAIARAISFEPRVVILDEPTANLSVMATERLLETMLELKKQGVAQIIISHRLQDIFAVGDRVMVLKRGENVGERYIQHDHRARGARADRPRRRGHGRVALRCGHTGIRGAGPEAGEMSQYATYPSLRDRSVFITGGGSGIGTSLVRHFAAQGSKVGFVDIAALRSAIKRVAEAQVPIIVPVNNAAHDERHAVDTVTPEYGGDRLAVKLRHQFFAAQAVRSMIRATSGGSIVNFGPVQAELFRALAALKALQAEAADSMTAAVASLPPPAATTKRTQNPL